MSINVKEVCQKLYYRMLDVNVGSEDGEDIFTDVLNRFDVIKEAKKYLTEFDKSIISKDELKKKLMAIEIENNIEDIDRPFVEEYMILGDQLWWLFNNDCEDEFDEFLYMSWEDIINSNSMMRQVYRDYKEDFDRL